MTPGGTRVVALKDWSELADVPVIDSKTGLPVESQNNYACCPSHCCVIHGCKYGYDRCPVVREDVKQEYICESCYNVLESWEETRREYESVAHIAKRIKELRESL